MRILDRYIARKFLQVFIFAIIAFLSIFIIVDLIENLDDFIDHKVPVRIVVDYYLYYLPFIIVLILPVTSLISSLFSVGDLARHNEIVSMKSAGMSLYRIFLPLFIVGILISGVSLGVANYLVPLSAEKKEAINREYMKGGKSPERLSNLYLQDNQGLRISMRYYNVATKIGNVVSIREFRDNQLISRIDVRKMVWQDSLWVLHNGYERIFQNDHETAYNFERRIFKETSMRPQNLSRMVKNPEEMSYNQLQDFIKEVKRNGGDPNRWLVDLYLKLALPFANFIIILFGAPLSSSHTQRSGAGRGFGVSLAVTFIYFGILKTTQAMGHNGRLHPLLAAWLANVIFGITGLFVLFKAKK